MFHHIDLPSGGTKLNTKRSLQKIPPPRKKNPPRGGFNPSSQTHPSRGYLVLGRIHMLDLGLGRPTHSCTKISCSNPPSYQFSLSNPSMYQKIIFKTIQNQSKYTKISRFLGKMTHPCAYIFDSFKTHPCKPDFWRNFLYRRGILWACLKKSLEWVWWSSNASKGMVWKNARGVGIYFLKINFFLPPYQSNWGLFFLKYNELLIRINRK